MQPTHLISSLRILGDRTPGLGNSDWRLGETSIPSLSVLLREDEDAGVDAFPERKLDRRQLAEEPREPRPPTPLRRDQ